jgi:hypothetical protein
LRTAEISRLPDARARAWLTGRAEEVRAAVALTVVDWRAGRISLEQALACARAYLEDLHKSAHESRVLESDADGSHGSRPKMRGVASRDGATAFAPVVAAAPARASGPQAGDTWVDPAGAVFEVFGRNGAQSAGDPGPALGDLLDRGKTVRC